MNAIRIEGHICEGQQLHPSNEKREVRVTVIRGGASVNGYYYNEAALRAIAGLLEHAQAYVDHARSEADNAVRSVRDMVGFYHSPAYVPPDTSAPDGRVDATLHILESAGWLWSIISEACALGHPELIGLSIDIYGVWQPRNDETPADGRAQTSSTVSARRQLAGVRTSAQPLKEVTRVLSLNSCDIVTRPSAGGAFQHILHSKGEVMDPTTNEIDISQNNGSAAATSASPAAFPASAPGSTTDGIQEQVREQVQAANAEVARLLEQVSIERSVLLLERRLFESQLPQPSQKVLRDRYKGRIVEEAQLDADIVAMKAMLGELTQSGMIRGEGYSRPMIGEQITEAEKIQAAFDGMFDLEIDKARLGNIVGFSSIREAYARVTGDPSIAGFTERTTLGTIRVSEAAPITRISEADTTTASFSYLLGTSMNKRLLKDYQAWPAEWMRFVTVTPIKDFKQQTRVRLGAFGSLSTVAEDTAYTTISLTDSAATYVPTKRGNLVTVSRETIVNDDLFAIKQIPTKLAVAAAYTLAEFVYAFLSSNPNIYDGNALFTSGAPHNNLGSSALSTTAMQSGVTAMREQTNFAGKRLGLRPRYLVVPPELEWAAMVATKSAGVPGSNNNDINPMMGYVTPIVSPQLASTTQWFFAADPNVVDTIEVGFVGGQVNPALFVQDLPLYGLNFTQDVIS